MKVDVARARYEPQFRGLWCSRIQQQRICLGGVAIFRSANDQDRALNGRQVVDRTKV
jgi:hypothetical protein